MVECPGPKEVMHIPRRASAELKMSLFGPWRTTGPNIHHLALLWQLVPVAYGEPTELIEVAMCGQVKAHGNSVEPSVRIRQFRAQRSRVVFQWMEEHPVAQNKDALQGVSVSAQVFKRTGVAKQVNWTDIWYYDQRGVFGQLVDNFHGVQRSGPWI